MRLSENRTAPLTVERIAIHMLGYPAWIFNETTLLIVDANKQALEFCQYEQHEFIGLSIRELWNGEDLSDILDELEVHSTERSFFGNLKHRKKSGEVSIMRVHATRLLYPVSEWVVDLVYWRGGL